MQPGIVWGFPIYSYNQINLWVFPNHNFFPLLQELGSVSQTALCIIQIAAIPCNSHLPIPQETTKLFESNGKFPHHGSTPKVLAGRAQDQGQLGQGPKRPERPKRPGQREGQPRLLRCHRAWFVAWLVSSLRKVIQDIHTLYCIILVELCCIDVLYCIAFHFNNLYFSILYYISMLCNVI